MKKINEKTPCVIVEPSDENVYGGTVLNKKSWDRIIITTQNGKKVAEVNDDTVTPTNGYLVKMYPVTD